jgi:hypothetical protein
MQPPHNQAVRNAKGFPGSADNKAEHVGTAAAKCEPIKGNQESSPARQRLAVPPIVQTVEPGELQAGEVSGWRPANSSRRVSLWPGRSMGLRALLAEMAPVIAQSAELRRAQPEIDGPLEFLSLAACRSAEDRRKDCVLPFSSTGLRLRRVERHRRPPLAGAWRFSKPVNLSSENALDVPGLQSCMPC